MRRIALASFRLTTRASRWLKLHLTPAGQLLAGGLVAAAVFGIDGRRTLASELAALLAGVLLTAALLALAIRRQRLSVVRELPRHVTAGQPARYRLHLRHHGRRPERSLRVMELLASPLPSREQFRRFRGSAAADGNWFDRRVGYPRWLECARHLRGAEVDPAAVALLADGEQVTLQMTVRPLRRGLVHFRETVVARPEPLGLVWRLQRLPTPDSLLVLPRRCRVAPPKAHGRRRYQPAGEGVVGGIGDSHEFAALRDYRPGDPLRHVHWRSWARTGRPVVKEFHEEYFDRNAVVLDTALGDGAPRCFECAVSIAASYVCADWGADALVELVIAGDDEAPAPGRGAAERTLALERLACVEPGAADALERAAGRLLAGAGRWSAAVCVLLAWDAARRALVRGLRARGVEVLVLLASDAPQPDAAGDAPLYRVRPQHLEADLGAVPGGVLGATPRPGAAAASG